MATRNAGFVGKLIATVFTSVVAPVVVSVAVRDLSSQEPKPTTTGKEAARAAVTDRAGQGPYFAPAPPVSQPRPETARVVARGTGRTPEEALREALRSALASALAAHGDAAQGVQVPDRLLQAEGVVLHWEERKSSRSWRPGGAVYSKDVAVTVDGRALAAAARGTRGGWHAPTPLTSRGTLR